MWLTFIEGVCYQFIRTMLILVLIYFAKVSQSVDVHPTLNWCMIKLKHLKLAVNPVSLVLVLVYSRSHFCEKSHVEIEIKDRRCCCAAIQLLCSLVVYDGVIPACVCCRITRTQGDSLSVPSRRCRTCRGQKKGNVSVAIDLTSAHIALEILNFSGHKSVFVLLNIRLTIIPVKKCK